DCADYLTKKGTPFREAYKITGQLVRHCIENNLTLETLPLEQYKQFSDIFEDDLFKAIDLQTCVEQRKVPGGPAAEAVTAQIAEMKERIKKLDSAIG
ncbi:MAG: argininosuccinate lyase, partial [Oscillospiraceae bacterium]|nr:argininosuccinate lyase [Oscillospiraceae bacterium]